MRPWIVGLMFVAALGWADSMDCFYRGDANGDDAVNIADVTVIASYVMGNYSGSLNDNMDALDANDDGSISIADSSYLSGILFSSYTWPAPNTTIGIGLDPTADNVNGESPDAGDYDVGEPLSGWGDGTAEVGQITGGTQWPYRDEDTEDGLTEIDKSGGMWEVKTLPTGSYDTLMNSFEFWFELDPLANAHQITVDQVNEACRYGTRSGPGLRFPYAYAWNIAMSQPSGSGYTSVFIDGEDAVIVIKIEVGPETVYIDIPIDLGKVGIGVMSYNNALYRYCSGAPYTNTCEQAEGVSSVSDEGEQLGVITVNVEQLRDALIPYPNLSPTAELKMTGIGFLTADNAPKAYHVAGTSDATLRDDVTALFLVGVPSVVTTTYYVPED